MEPGEQQELNSGGTLTVYPTALKARAVVRDAVRVSGAVVGNAATTFPELTDTLARQLGVTGRVLPPELTALVLEAAIGDLPDLSTTLAGCGRGLVREFHEAIDELKAARLGPADVRQMVDGLPTFEIAVRVGELARIYAAYERRLAAIGALDRHGREWEVAERLAGCVERGERPAVLGGVTRIVFAELYDFSVLQFLIATALIRLVGDAELVAFAHPENVDATRFLDRTWNRFVGSEAIADRVLPSFVVRGGRHGSLAVALRGVFAQPSLPPQAGDGSIRILVGPHRYGEVEVVLRDVRRRLEAGADPERLALVCRDLAPYAGLIDDVARRFRVPMYFRKGESLLASGAVREAIGLVRGALEGLPRARVAAVLESDYFRFRRPTAAALLAQAGYVSAAVCPVAECLAHHATREAHGGPEAQLRTVRRVERHRGAIQAVARAVDGLVGVRTVAGHVRVVRATLRALGFRAVAREVLDPGAAARDARACRRFDDLLGSLAAVSGALRLGPIPLERFLALVLDGTQRESPTEPDAGGGVRALSVLDARGLDFDIVYLLGLDDGTFPAAHRESAVLPDAVKRALGDLATPVLQAQLGERAAGLRGGLLRTAREQSLEDPFLFFLAVSMAEQELVLAYPAADARRNPTVRSPFVDEVAACLTEPLAVTQVFPATLVASAATCCDESELVARAASDRWRPETPGADRLTPVLRARLVDGAARVAEIDRRARVEEARARYFLTPLHAPARAAAGDAWVGRVPASDALRGRIDAMTWSPTRFEALAACGFKFFAARVLGLREREETAADVGARERGTLLHRVLELLLGAMPAWPFDVDEAQRQARALVIALRPTIEASVTPKDRALLDVEWGRVLAVVDAVARLEVGEERAAAAEGSVRERLLEWPFQFAIAPGDGTPVLAVQGTADRIDVWRREGTIERVRVRDYKTARNVQELRRRLGYQIPLYLDAALRTDALGVPSDAAAEGGYWSPLAAPGQRDGSRPFARAELTAVEDELRALVATARAGHFDVAPQQCDDWCPYRAVCRYQPPPVEDDGG